MKRSLFALALAAALPMSAQASNISHIFAELDYAHSDVLDENLNGYAFKGEAAMGDNFYALGSYSRVGKSNIDLGFYDQYGNTVLIDVDYTQTAIGAGFHRAISDNADWNVELSYVRDELGYSANQYGTLDQGDNGYRVATGARFMMGSKFEGNFNVNYTDVNDFGSGVGAGIGGVFHINETWGIAGGYDHADREDTDINTWHLGVRASF
jgi:hypothetical protein